MFGVRSSQGPLLYTKLLCLKINTFFFSPFCFTKPVSVLQLEFDYLYNLSLYCIFFSYSNKDCGTHDDEDTENDQEAS